MKHTQIVQMVEVGTRFQFKLWKRWIHGAAYAQYGLRNYTVEVVRKAGKYLFVVRHGEVASNG